jgi:hypothetical protein
MLTEIRCSRFHESPIYFKDGLNVILGDNLASNSIGKSSLLLAIDFVFGGNTFKTFNNGAVSNIGDHYYCFCFKFHDIDYYYKRGTLDHDIIYECDKNYNETKQLPIAEYTSFLNTKYDLVSNGISFRQFVGLFSRVWGKQNLDVNKPLHSRASENMNICVTRLINIFNEYQSIASLESQFKLFSDEKSNLMKAFKHKIIPKIDKRTYESNRKEIEGIYNELKTIKESLARRMCNINEILNNEIFDLKIKKDALVNIKTKIANKIERVNNNIRGASFKRTSEFEQLKNYFADVNIDRLSKVEAFHSGISAILIEELSKSRVDLQQDLLDIENEIKKIDA